MNKCHCCSYRWTIPGNSSQQRLLTQQQLKDSYLTYYLHVKKARIESDKIQFMRMLQLSHIHVAIGPIQKATIRDQRGAVLQECNL